MQPERNKIMTPNSNSEGKNNQIFHSNSKLSRLIDEYDLDELGKQLEEYWIAAPDDRYSLRELAVYVNQYLLRTVMQKLTSIPSMAKLRTPIGCSLTTMSALACAPKPAGA